MAVKSLSWLLLIAHLPGRNPALRMQFWGALKLAGAGLLRDGAYVLPNTDASRQFFESQGAKIKGGGGQAHLFAFNADSSDQTETLGALFDRSSEYVEVVKRLETLKRGFEKLREPEARQRVAIVHREIAAIVARDLFPGKPRERMQSAFAGVEAAFNARFVPDEPHAALSNIERRERKDYRGRLWATRERLWIDRVASAWLIRRFIDAKAKFLWLKRIKDLPKQAVGFDFDGAEFTHVDSKITFEVLLVSFMLERDVGLIRLGRWFTPSTWAAFKFLKGPALSRS